MIARLERSRSSRRGASSWRERSSRRAPSSLACPASSGAPSRPRFTRACANRPATTSSWPASTRPSMRLADRLGGAAVCAALAICLSAGVALPLRAAKAPGPAPPPPPTISDRHYPLNRAGELKARLLERPKDSAAAAWALEYAATPEVSRLDPMARAAERSWAAQLGLAATPTDEERRLLQGIADSIGNCPLDSVAIKRAAQGLT